MLFFEGAISERRLLRSDRIACYGRSPTGPSFRIRKDTIFCFSKPGEGPAHFLVSSWRGCYLGVIPGEFLEGAIYRATKCSSDVHA